LTLGELMRVPRPLIRNGVPTSKGNYREGREERGSEREGREFLPKSR